MVSCARRYPLDAYVRKVKMQNIVIFTVWQALLLAVLFVVKSSPIGISFPLFIAFLPVCRGIIGKVLPACSWVS